MRTKLLAYNSNNMFRQRNTVVAVLCINTSLTGNPAGGRNHEENRIRKDFKIKPQAVRNTTRSAS